MVSNEPSEQELIQAFRSLPDGQGTGRFLTQLHASLITIPDTGVTKYRIVGSAVPDYEVDAVEFWTKLVIAKKATLVVNMYGNSEIIDT